MPTEDEYAREVIRTVSEMSERLVAYRQDVQRAIGSLQSWATENRRRIEAQEKLNQALHAKVEGVIRRLDEDADERPKRQEALDAKLTGLNDKLRAQDRVLFSLLYWIRRIAIVGAVAAIAGALIYAGTLL